MNKTGLGASLIGFDQPSINEYGDVAFVGTFSPGSTSSIDSAIYADTGSGLELASPLSLAVPGMSGFTIRSQNVFPDPFISNDGNILFGAEIMQDGTSATQRALLAVTNSGLQTIATAGLPVDGFAPGLTFGQPSVLLPKITTDGRVAFRTTLTGGDVVPPQLNGTALFEWHNGDYRMLARTGFETPAPTADFFVTLGDVTINDSQQAAFFANAFDFATAELIDGLWTDRNGQFDLIAAVGDVVPGPTGQATIAQLGMRDWLEINGRGNVVFHARLTGGGIDGLANSLLAETPGGDLVLVAFEGQSIEVRAGDFREIDVIDFLSRPEGDAFNDRGEIAFRLRFTDGTEGVFLSTIAVPEPSGILLAGFGLAAMVLITRCQRRCHA